MVLRVSTLIPDMKQAHFTCTQCNRSVDVVIDRGHIAEPLACAGCKGKHSMRLMHNRSVFTDKQIIKLQEAPDNIPEGETPQTVTMLMYDALVDTSKVRVGVLTAARGG
jgi:DNA replication licensing factor MCM4